MHQIIRDTRYRNTYRRDMLRQRLRRLVHRGACVYEKVRYWPQWQQAMNAGARSKTLSICIITLNAAGRIPSLLTYLRPLCDEIVVGVDSKTTDNTFEVCRGLADELFRIKNPSKTCNAGLEALVSRCHGDWILRLDDDEFPEPHFFRFKDALLADSRFTHYKLPRLHLASVDASVDTAIETSPDPVTPALTWINDGYLYPDFQLRLFKNDPSLLSFPGAIGHASIECAGPRGKLNTVHLVHLNMAMNPRHKRAEKLQRYIDRLDGQWVHPVNEHALLFEDFHYRIAPYRYPDEAFRRLLAETTLAQRRQYPPDDSGTITPPSPTAIETLR